MLFIGRGKSFFFVLEVNLFLFLFSHEFVKLPLDRLTFPILETLTHTYAFSIHVQDFFWIEYTDASD